MYHVYLDQNGENELYIRFYPDEYNLKTIVAMFKRMKKLSVVWVTVYDPDGNIIADGIM